MEFGTQELYRDVNLFVGPEDRIGLAGANGSGKSTILKLMSGELEPTRGSVDKRRGTCVGYLPQTGAVVGERTVLEEALTADRLPQKDAGRCSPVADRSKTRSIHRLHRLRRRAWRMESPRATPSR